MADGVSCAALDEFAIAIKAAARESLGADAELLLLLAVLSDWLALLLLLWLPMEPEPPRFGGSGL